MQNQKTEFKPESYYHIYNKAVGDEKLFYNTDNYRFFLHKLKYYTSPLAYVMTYCLLPNHFHLLIKTKTEKEIRNNNSLDVTDYSSVFSRKFSHFFNAYSQALNKQQNRYGSLFKNRFQRVQLSDEDYLQKLIVYIHTNPAHHNYSENYETWEFSSYALILSNQSTALLRDEVIDLFDNLENFKYCHQQKKLELEERYLLE